MKIIEDNWIYKTSSAVVYRELSTDLFAVWNRYAPSVIFLNEDSIKLLQYMETNEDPYKEFKGFKRILRKFISANLLFRDEDSYKDYFINGGDEGLSEILANLEGIRSERVPYADLTIINNRCNLKCPYCVVNFARGDEQRTKTSKEERIKTMLGVIDQFLGLREEFDWHRRRKIQFNGGEMLLEWDVIEAIMQHVKKNHPRMKIDYHLNTNGTLIDEEKAKIMGKKMKSIGISIDGYEEMHNTTRVYHDGRGSYDDVIKGLSLYNKYLPGPRSFYQGTFEPGSEINYEKIQEMGKYGFVTARMGVNLLGTTNAQAKEVAKTQFDLSIKSMGDDVRVYDRYIDVFKGHVTVRKGKMNKLRFFCGGLSFTAGKCAVYNLDTESMGLLCSYASNIRVPLDEIDNDIYHEKVFRKSAEFLTERLRVFKSECADCEIAGICRGGCFLQGIDSHNKINEAACVFQLELWDQFLKHVGGQS